MHARSGRRRAALVPLAWLLLASSPASRDERDELRVRGTVVEFRDEDNGFVLGTTVGRAEVLVVKTPDTRLVRFDGQGARVQATHSDIRLGGDVEAVGRGSARRLVAGEIRIHTIP